MDASPIPDAGEIFLSVLAFFFLLLGGAYFAGSETSLSTVNRIRVMSRADDGDKRAEKVLYILDHFDDALSAILVGNNIMHIGSASLATVTAVKLWGDGATGITTAVTTLLVFFLAEMIPKAFARTCSERFAYFCAPSLRVIMKVLAPVGRFFGRLRRLFDKDNGEMPTVTEEELHDIIENIDEEDEVESDTAELVQSALEFTETPATEIYTPWDKVLTVSTDMDPREIETVIRGSAHSRLPVVNDAGEVTGMLQIRKYLKAYFVRNGHVSLKKVMDKPYFIRSGLNIDELLEQMSGARTHAAVVLDADGKAVGLLTVEDILEELVGEIYDEKEAAV